jgi:hypothetical protein
MPAGRPSEGRVRLNIHVFRSTAKILNGLVDKHDPQMNTQGKILDHHFSKKTRSKKNG